MSLSFLKYPFGIYLPETPCAARKWNYRTNNSGLSLHHLPYFVQDSWVDPEGGGGGGVPSHPGRPQVAIGSLRNTGMDPLREAIGSWEAIGPLGRGSVRPWWLNKRCQAPFPHWRTFSGYAHETVRMRRIVRALAACRCYKHQNFYVLACVFHGQQPLHRLYISPGCTFSRYILHLFSHVDMKTQR